MLKDKNIIAFYDTVQEVRNVGILMLERVKTTNIRKKGITDFVTDTDVIVQEQLKKRLKKLDENIQFMGEEQDNTGISLENPTWILDPVDGTTNLIHNFGNSAISLALLNEGEIIWGIVFNPFTNEMFTARKGCGAFCNGSLICVSNAPDLSCNLVSAGTNPGRREEAQKAFNRMKNVYDRCHDIRRLGTASVELCYVACGRLDGYFEHGLKPWDFAAGKLIVEEAGGKVTDFSGNSTRFDTEKCDVLATNGKIHYELEELL